ncbi:MAG TPA: DUF2309 domain-containing protein, partial [Pirellulales bacterium]|nr:DUF2309 domain-containing protein [Pirellulales bacterium]
MLSDLVERARALLPAQGPLAAFAFINPLQALEDVPFDEAVKRGARLFGCQPYLSEDRYRQKLQRDRIRRDDLQAAVREDLGALAKQTICGLSTRYDLRLAMLEHPLRIGTSDELRWFVAETDALQRFRREVSPEHRDRLIRDTHRWLQESLRNEAVHGERSKSPGCTPEIRELVLSLLSRHNDATVEHWNDRTWERISVQVLWRVCLQGAAQVQGMASQRATAIRHRDVVRDATGHDTDRLVDEVLVRYSAAFADQGFAQCPLPCRSDGFFRAFFEMYRRPRLGEPGWLRDLSTEISRIETAGLSPIECVQESLEWLGVPEAEWDDFISATLLVLRGWAGILSQLEVRPDRVAVPAPAGTLLEFLAVRLLLDRVALAYVAKKQLHDAQPLSTIRQRLARERAPTPPENIEQRAFILFKLAQLLGWSPLALVVQSNDGWQTIFTEIESFSSWERRRIYQRAFERQLRERALDALSIHAMRPRRECESPRFQAVFCIDAREESYRRHLEEASSEFQTFGMAGFFGVPMYFRGAADAHYAAVCPVVVYPKHWVTEDVLYPLGESHRRRAKTRRALGMASHRLHIGSRQIASGTLLTAGIGVLASIPLTARLLFPRVTAKIRRLCSSLVESPKLTRLWLERTAENPGPDGDAIGFTVEEMADLATAAVRDLGLVSNFARLVFFLGHGSSTMNNPHNSVYNCGACSGNTGGANARALAAMLNDRRVKEILVERGIEIPCDTYFVGGLHNTCTDAVTFFDLDLLPKSHRGDFEEARHTFELAARRNAHERCRRFESAPLKITPAEAKYHVESRAEDLAQTRPEYGNASNAFCIVGRRSLTEGLFLDRRSFLQSYDPNVDDENCNILNRILSAVVPVCSGINLQYFFSYVDSNGWGCGSKLPHNVSALLGVMDGAMSDLRSGLPWQ